MEEDLYVDYFKRKLKGITFPLENDTIKSLKGLQLKYCQSLLSQGFSKLEDDEKKERIMQMNLVNNEIDYRLGLYDRLKGGIIIGEIETNHNKSCCCHR